MRNETLIGRKLDAYVLVKILKYCTGSSARSYQCKFAVSSVFGNKSIESMEELGAAIKEIIQYKTIRGKFSSVHPDLAAEGITRVEVGEEGLHFIRNNGPGLMFLMQHYKIQHIFTDDAEGVVLDKDEDEEEMLRRAIAMSLEDQEEELPIRTGLILKDDIAKSQRAVIKRLQGG